MTFVIFTGSVSAQLEYNHPNQDIPVKTQEQLNKSLETAKIVKGTGTVITLTGVGFFVASAIKAVQLDNEYGAVDPPREENAKWARLVLGGCALTTIGLGTRLVGRVHEKKIKAELVKFQGSGMSYGLALKVRF